ncbi:MAG: EutN/CcmL family microcompartment protein [Planctomycetota bacterium]
MKVATVIGTVVTPIQHPAFEHHKLLLIRPEQPTTGERSGKTLIAIDLAQAGIGDKVLVIDEGSSARTLLGSDDAPIKTTIVGVIDEIEIRGERVYPRDEE